MTPIYVFITRPDAYECYMGGDRNLTLWIEEPCYDHQSYLTDFDSMRYIDCGWKSARQNGIYAKPLLKQDDELRKAVWHEVYLSLLPKGMGVEEGKIWDTTVIDKDAFGGPDTNWRNLYTDRDWEGKCNTCHKRFLLKIELRSGEVTRILPSVAMRPNWALSDVSKGWVKTDQIEPFYASEYFHTEEDAKNAIPF